LANGDSAVMIAAEQSFLRKDAHRLSHCVARNAEGGGERNFLERGTGTKFSIENALTEQRCHLVGNTDPIDLCLLHVP